MSAEPPVHRIRLRAPWQVRPHVENVPVGTMTVPGTLRDGGWDGFAGRVSFYRRFGRPSNLGAKETVWLMFDCVVGQAEVRMNDEPLGALDRTGAFDVTRLLTMRNSLEVIVDATDDACGIAGEVTLEIRSA